MDSNFTELDHIKLTDTDPIRNRLVNKIVAGRNVHISVQEDIETGEQYLLIEADGGTAGEDISAATQRWVRFSVNDTPGNTVLKSTGLPAPFPDLSFFGTTTALFNTAGVISIDQNPTQRIYGNTAIDQLMRLDNLSGEYRCKFFICKIKRDTATTPVVNAQFERIFQYGSQGNDAFNSDGGWVSRINADSAGGSFFPLRSLAFAVHTKYNPDEQKPGNQTTPQFPDPIVVSRVFTDAEWQAGITMMFVVEDPRPAKFKGWIITGQDAVAKVLGNQEEWEDPMQANTVTWPLPGMSIEGPGNDSTSNGFSLFNQSVNQSVLGMTSPLKKSQVSPIWIGTCRDMDEARNIFVTYWANPNADLSVLLT